MNRLRTGYCSVVNPYGGQTFRVSLRPDDVDGIVFWTKNAGPFLPYLSEVAQMGYPFFVQYTINGYPRALENRVVDARAATGHAAAIRSRFGPRAVVWRYDTIVSTSLTPAGFHLENFGRIAESLRGVSDEVVISFAHLYRKTERNLSETAHGAGFEWWDPAVGEKRAMAAKLAGIAQANGMQLTICSQPEFAATGTVAARCVDAQRLGDISGRPIEARLKGNRPGCGCFESRDIGDYDTCPHGCVYCYAVRNRGLALERYQRHDPDSEFLFTHHLAT